MTAKHLKENGHHTAHNDPKRLVWYSMCLYWTDNWTKLKQVGSGAEIGQGIPCCPICECVGFKTTFEDWQQSASKYEIEGHPFYKEFLNESKEKCFGRSGGKMFMETYREWLKKRNES